MSRKRTNKTGLPEKTASQKTDETPSSDRTMNRRTFLKAAGITGAGLIGSPLLTSIARAKTSAASGYKKPNLLVIVVDQLRTPQYFPQQSVLDLYLPNLAALRKASVSFDNYHTAAIACTPSRGTLLTGLYAQQTFLMATQVNDMTPSLNTAFPTWGKMLQSFGYQTWWFGKWHLSEGDTLTPYGFEGGTFPSPNGDPGQGYLVDPYIVNGGTPPAGSGLMQTPQFAQWLASNASTEPWCTTVSLVNPHDITSYFDGTINMPEYQNPPQVFTAGVPNFETTDQLLANKPGLQADFQSRINSLSGSMPSASLSNANDPVWLNLLNTYLVAQMYVDQHVGQVMSLLKKAGYANNTIVIFTSDHGEHGGAHGLRAKAGTVYRETINVPLYVSDPTGQWGATPNTTRDQLYSSVDIAPLLLTFATGSGAWRQQSAFSPLMGRADITAGLGSPSAAGRPYVLHTTDEVGFEEAKYSPPDPTAPSHVIGYVTPKYKLGAYSNWESGTVKITATGRQQEVYDYTNADGTLEVDNVAETEPTLTTMLSDALFNDAVPNELRRPLPASYQSAQEAAAAAYLKYAASYTD